MRHKQRFGKSGGGATVLTLVLGLLPILYAASIGPSYAMMAHGQLGWDRFSLIYRPVVFVYEQDDTLQTMTDAYLD
jgi:hypothetical protein